MPCGADYVVNHFYSPDVAKNYSAEHIQLMRSQFDVDTLVTDAQEKAKANRFTKEVKIQVGKNVGMHNVTEEIKQKFKQKFKQKISTTTQTDTVQTSNRSDTDIDTRADEEVLTASSIDPGSKSTHHSVSPAPVENQEELKLKKRLNDAFPGEITQIGKGNVIEVPKKTLEFIMAWPKAKENFVFKSTTEERGKIICANDKMKTLVAIMEYYATIREPLQKLKKCLTHYSSNDSSSKNISNAIAATFKKMSSQKCDLTQEMAFLEKMTKAEHKRTSFNLFHQNDHTLTNTINEIKGMLPKQLAAESAEKPNITR